MKSIELGAWYTEEPLISSVPAPVLARVPASVPALVPAPVLPLRVLVLHDQLMTFPATILHTKHLMRRKV